MRTQVSQTSLSAYRSLSTAALTGTEMEVMAVTILVIQIVNQ